MNAPTSDTLTNDTIAAILACRIFAVVGASANPDKYGYKVWRILREYGKMAYPVNPNAAAIDGETAYPDIAALPEAPEVVVSVVPPAATETLPAAMAARGVRYLWLQPGAESDKAVADARTAGIAVVADGACVMVALRSRVKK